MGTKRDFLLKQKEDDLRKKLTGEEEEAVLKELGKPVEKKGNEWKFLEKLGMGMHSFQQVYFITFKDGKVSDVRVEEEGIGCAIME